MTREEKLQRLHAINICSQPTVSTNDMGLEYVVITSTGAGTGFGEISQWPCFRFFIDEELRSVLVRRDAGEKITPEDIMNLEFAEVLCSTHNLCVGFHPLTYDITAEVISGILKHLDAIKADASDFFALCIWNGTVKDPILCSTQKILKEKFLDQFSWVCKDYADMSDDELNYWYNFVEEHGETLVCTNYGFPELGDENK